MKNIGIALVFMALLSAVAFADDFGMDVDVGRLYASPVITDMNVSDYAGNLVTASNPTKEGYGNQMHFNATWTDADGDNVTFYVCNTSGFTHGVGCDDTEICSAAAGTVSPVSCSYYVLDSDPAVSWTAYAFVDDDYNASVAVSNETYTDHRPTIGGTLDFTGDLVNYANDTLTLNITGLIASDVDGDTTEFWFIFYETPDGGSWWYLRSALPVSSGGDSYDCTSDGGGTGLGYCSRFQSVNDTVIVVYMADDEHGARRYSSHFGERYGDATMNISDTVPTIDSVLIDDVASPSVNPTENGFTSVKITANISDYDIVNDPTELTGGLANATSTSSYYGTNTTCDYSVVDADTAAVNCQLFVAYNATGGSKTVTVEASDIADASDSDSGSSFTYSTIYAIWLNDTSIDFGTAIRGTNDNAGDELKVSNSGNGVNDVNITGADLNFTTNYILIGNMTIDDDATPSEGVETGKTEMQLTESPQDYTPTGGISVDDFYNLWFFLDIPVGQTEGTYTSEADFELISFEHI
jgi:hypothetical protein